MSQESKEGLLDHAKDNSAEKLDSDDESTIPVEVEFKIRDKSKYKTSSNRLRFVFNEDLSVKEASERAFETYFGDIPQEIRVLIQAKGSSPSAIANMTVKIKRILKEGDTLILSDDLDENNRKQTVDFISPILLCFALPFMGLCVVGTIGIGIFTMILFLRYLFTVLSDNGYLWK